MQHKRLLFLGVLLALVLAVAGPAFAAPQDPLAPLVGVDSPDAIAGQYIVVFKDDAGFEAADEALMDALSASDSGKGVELGTEVSPEARQAALDRAGINVQHRYTDALNGFAATLPPQAVAALRRNPNVAYIEVDSIITIDATQTPVTWGMDRIDQSALPLNNTYTYKYTGAGVTAYIIDTGILASPQRVRRPRQSRYRYGRRWQERHRLQRPWHARRGHRRRQHLWCGKGRDA